MTEVLRPGSVHSGYSEPDLGYTPVPSWLTPWTEQPSWFTASSGTRTDATSIDPTDIASALRSIAEEFESMASSRQQGTMTSVAQTPGTSNYSGITYTDASWPGSTQDLWSFESNATNAEPAAVAPLTQSRIRKLRHVNSHDLLEWCQSYTEKESKYPSDSSGGPLGAQGHEVWIQRQLHSNAFWDHLIERSESSLGRATSALKWKHTSPREESTAAKIGADLQAAAWIRMRALVGVDEDQQTVVSTDSTSQGFKDLVSSTGSDAPPTSNGLPAPEYSAGDAFLPDPTSDPALVNANGDDLHPDALDADMGDGGGDSAGAD